MEYWSIVIAIHMVVSTSGPFATLNDCMDDARVRRIEFVDKAAHNPEAWGVILNANELTLDDVKAGCITLLGRGAHP